MNKMTLPSEPLLPLILVVSDALPGHASEHFGDLERTEFTQYMDLASALVEYQPDIVLSSLFANGFDAGDLATSLDHHQFSGRYRILNEPLPNFEMILAELRESAPKLDIDFMVLEPVS